MKGACHCSFLTIRKFLRDVIGVTISRGQLSKLIQKASAAFEQAYNELLEYLPHEAKLNIDETGHKEKKTVSGLGVFAPMRTPCSRLPTREVPRC